MNGNLIRCDALWQQGLASLISCERSSILNFDSFWQNLHPYFSERCPNYFPYQALRQNYGHDNIDSILGSPNNMHYNIYIRNRNCDQNIDVTITIRRTILIPRSDLFICGFKSISTLSWYSFAYGTSQQQECIVYCCNTSQNLEKRLNSAFCQASLQLI